MGIKTVGIVGYGSFGMLAHALFRRFAPSVGVRIFSPDKKPDGKEFFSLAETAQCDAVILAVPIHAYEEVLREIVPLMPNKSLIVDVATVKMHTVQLLEKYAQGKRYIATHPVWGPESYKQRSGDISGFRIVITGYTLKAEEYKKVVTRLENIGFNIVEMSPEEHDKYIAETLFLTHFIGQIVSRAGIKRTAVDTVSFGWLMNAVDDVQHDEELFKDVYKYNPYCKDVLAGFLQAEAGINDLLEGPKKEMPKSGLNIGVSGAQGSFSQEAAEKYIEDSKLKDCTLKYLISVEKVLGALEARTIDLGIFPIQNSTGGIVTETVYATAAHSFAIKKLFDIDVHQNLLALPGVKRGEIETIVSHEQALRQCRNYLKSEWPNTKIEEYEDTAKAAQDLAAGKLPKTTAVIASAAAAKIYKLNILGESIQDLKTNYTTFLAASAL